MQCCKILQIDTIVIIIIMIVWIRNSVYVIEPGSRAKIYDSRGSNFVYRHIIEKRQLYIYYISVFYKKLESWTFLPQHQYFAKLFAFFCIMTVKPTTETAVFKCCFFNSITVNHTNAVYKLYSISYFGSLRTNTPYIYQAPISTTTVG